MGCSTSAALAEEQKQKEEVTPTSLSVAGTGGLVLVLNQAFLRESFRQFVSSAWVPSTGSDMNANFSSSARTIGLNFIDFWIDVKDYSGIPRSAFRSFRAW